MEYIVLRELLPEAFKEGGRTCEMLEGPIMGPTGASCVEKRIRVAALIGSCRDTVDDRLVNAKILNS